MQEAFGGVLSFVLIVIFLVIISGILGFLVNYSKAFRMKNEIIAAIEEYDGKGCFSDTSTGDTSCRSAIKDAAKNLGYSPKNFNCNTSKLYVMSDDLFCYKRNESASTSAVTYTIEAVSDIDIPIMNKILQMSIFRVHGDTRKIEA